jgi:AsmA protein
LRAKQIAWSELSAFVNPRPKERPWYRVLESSTPAGSPFLANLRAEGRVTADKLQVQNLAPTRVSANVKLERGKMEISALNADFLGGEQRGEWDADFGAKIAVCHGSGTLTGVSLAQLADTMKDDWIEGTGDGTYEVKGTCAGGFWGSAEGTLAFDVRDGSLPHVSLAEGAYGLQIEQLAGHARLHGGTLEIKDAKMDSPEGKFDVSGIASLKREVDFKLVRSSSGTTGYTITGTLAEPKVVPLAGGETQARLKGEPAK